jgi:hypothetical protein
VTPPRYLQIRSVHDTLLIIAISSFLFFLSSSSPCHRNRFKHSGICPTPATEPRAPGRQLPSERLVALARRKPHASHSLPFFSSPAIIVISYPLPSHFPFLALSLPRHIPLPFGPPSSKKGFRLLPTLVCQASTKAFLFCPLDDPSPPQRRQVLGPS